MTGIITLFQDEFRLLKDNCLLDNSRRVGDFRFFIGEIGAHKIVFSDCRPDQVEIAAASQAMIDIFKPEFLIASSTALTLVPFIETGDIIVANYFVVPQSQDFFNDEPDWNNSRMIETDSRIISSIRTAADALGDHNPQTVFGSVIDASENDMKTPRLKNMTKKMGIMGADRYGVTAARIAGLNHVPFIITEIAYPDSDNLKRFLGTEAKEKTIEKLFNLKLILLTELTRSRTSILR